MYYLTALTMMFIEHLLVEKDFSFLFKFKYAGNDEERTD